MITDPAATANKMPRLRTVILHGLKKRTGGATDRDHFRPTYTLGFYICK